MFTGHQASWNLYVRARCGPGLSASKNGGCIFLNTGKLKCSFIIIDTYRGGNEYSICIQHNLTSKSPQGLKRLYIEKWLVYPPPLPLLPLLPRRNHLHPLRLLILVDGPDRLHRRPKR